MKILIQTLASTLLLTASAIANSKPIFQLWQNLEVERKYTLAQNIVWPIGQRPVYPRFLAGSKFSFLTAQGLDGISVILVRLQALECPDATATAEMILIDPVSNPSTPTSDHRVGVALQPACIVEVFVETKDYAQNSLFNL